METKRWITPDAAVAMLRGFVDASRKRNEDASAIWWEKIIDGITERRTMYYTTSDGTRYDIQYRGGEK